MKKITLFIILFSSHISMAKKTNMNKVTSEFSDHISDKAKLDDNISSNMETAQLNINSGPAYEVFSPHEVSISNSNMEDRGRLQRSKMEYFNLLEIDYSKPGVKKHQEDIKEIIRLTNDKIGKILEFLRKNGIDCNEFSKESSKEEKPFLIDIEKIPTKEVDYKAHFCEHLSGNYNCISTLNIRCEKKSMKWDDWQAKSITISGPELLSSGYSFFYSAHVADKVFEKKLFSPHSKEYRYVKFNSSPVMKIYLAKRLALSLDSISDDMTFSWEGGIYPLGGKDYAWRYYNINYKYRDGEEICEKWSDEKWEESCSFGAA